MLTTIALIVIAQGQDQDSPKQQQAAPIIQKMLQHYSSAKTLTGTIKLSQGVGKAAPGSLITTVQFEKPAKLYIKQVLNTSEPQQWLVTSDGVKYSYNSPDYLPGASQRLIEKVSPRRGEVLDIRGIYGVVGQSLGDRTAPLDIAIGRPVDLQLLTSQLVTLEYGGKTKLGELEVHVIQGGWRPYNVPATAKNPIPVPAVGRFVMYISDDGDFKRYVITQLVQPSANMQPVEVTSQWDIDLVVNGKPDPNLFQVVL